MERLTYGRNATGHNRLALDHQAMSEALFLPVPAGALPLFPCPLPATPDTVSPSQGCSPG